MPRVRKSYENANNFEHASGICCISDCARVGTRLFSSLRGSYPLKNVPSNSIRRVCEGHYRKDLRHHKLKETNPGSKKKLNSSSKSSSPLMTDSQELDYIAVPVNYSEPDSPVSDSSLGSPTSPLSPLTSSPTSNNFFPSACDQQNLYNNYYSQLVAAYIYYQQQWQHQAESTASNSSNAEAATQALATTSASNSDIIAFTNKEYEFDEAIVGKCNRFRSFCEFVLKIESVI